jgi:hypothetical protein
MTTPKSVVEILPPKRDDYEREFPQRAPEVPQRRSSLTITARRLA